MQQVGARLRDARTARGMSLDDVAQITKIPRSAIAAIEDGDTSSLPAPVFVRGFVRALAGVVGLDGNELVRALGEEMLASNRQLPLAAQRRRDPGLASFLGDHGHRGHRGGFRPSHLLMLLVAIGMLVAAFLMVGSRSRVASADAEPTPSAAQDAQDGLTTFSDVQMHR